MVFGIKNNLFVRGLSDYVTESNSQSGQLPFNVPSSIVDGSYAPPSRIASVAISGLESENRLIGNDMGAGSPNHRRLSDNMSAAMKEDNEGLRTTVLDSGVESGLDQVSGANTSHALDNIVSTRIPLSKQNTRRKSMFRMSAGRVTLLVAGAVVALSALVMYIRFIYNRQKYMHAYGVERGLAEVEGLASKTCSRLENCIESFKTEAQQAEEAGDSELRESLMKQVGKLEALLPTASGMVDSVTDLWRGAKKTKDQLQKYEPSDLEKFEKEKDRGRLEGIRLARPAFDSPLKKLTSDMKSVLVDMVGSKTSIGHFQDAVWTLTALKRLLGN